MPRGRKSRLFNVQITYTCEWSGCCERFTETRILNNHLLEHFQTFAVQAFQGQCQPNCPLCSVVLNVEDFDLIQRHSYFHAWTNQLRANGQQLQILNDWPQCNFEMRSFKQIPELPTKFECGWLHCDFQTNDVAVFISHSSMHPEEYSDTRYPKGTPLKCLWDQCKYVGRQLKNLSAHMDSHTQRKRVACPTCGLLLVDFNKLEDHLKRQQMYYMKDNDDKSSQKVHHSIKPVKCTRCHRMFSTKKLMLNHVRRHVNTVKCPYCDMTTFGKSGLERHIMFRHSSERPYACPHCSDRFKHSSGVNRHVKLVHEKIWKVKQQLVESSTRSHLSGVDANEPIQGPLAQAGVLCTSVPLDLSIQSATQEDQLEQHKEDVHLGPYTCPYLGCNFQTMNEKGFFIHLGRKHLANNESTDDSQLDVVKLHRRHNAKVTDQTNSPLYVCHMCPVVKRHGIQLSKHLMKDHNLSRPSGHVRFTYTLSDDGHYRLQLTRLDTIPVASELLGEKVVNHLLNTQKQTI